LDLQDSYGIIFEMKNPVLCPRCHQKTNWENNPHRPFCSERCRTIDLGRWLSEDYRIPAGPDEDSDQISENSSRDPEDSKPKDKS